MVVVLFRAMLTEEAGADYATMAGELLVHARTLPGFIDFTTYEAANGEHLSVIRWESQELLRAWSDDMRHVIAQRLGRDKWYRYFRIEIAEIARSYGFDRDAGKSG